MMSENNSSNVIEVKWSHTKSEWLDVQLFEAEWRIYASVTKPSLVQIVAWRRPGAKPLSEPMLEYC